MGEAGSLLDATRTRAIRRRMLHWGRQHFVDFPWRLENRPWISLATEVLLQRTKAKQVVPVYEHFQSRYPTAMELARSSREELLSVVGTLGLHWRVPLMLKMAGMVAERGRPPENLEDLEALPGVGPYAAGAYLSLHRGKRAVIIDANVVRWLGRVLGRRTDAETRRKAWVREAMETLTPKRAFRAFNYAVLDLAMQLCSPSSPRCEECPLAPSLCVHGRKLLRNRAP